MKEWFVVIKKKEGGIVEYGLGVLMIKVLNRVINECNSENY